MILELLTNIKLLFNEAKGEESRVAMLFNSRKIMNTKIINVNR